MHFLFKLSALTIFFGCKQDLNKCRDIQCLAGATDREKVHKVMLQSVALACVI